MKYTKEQLSWMAQVTLAGLSNGNLRAAAVMHVLVSLTGLSEEAVFNKIRELV